MPRSLPLLLVALLAAGAVVWLVWPTDTDTYTDTDTSSDAGDSRIGAPSDEEAPALLRGGEDASTIPLQHRGPGALLGLVLQGGEGRAADVSVHLLESFSGVDPLGMWRGRSFLQRILDGGVATGRALATTRSGADGRFTIDGLASGAYELRAVADDGSRARATVSIPAAGARVEARLELPEGGETLTGRVVYEDGTRFQGFVTVSTGSDMEAILMTGAGAVVASVDGQGGFVVAGLPPGPAVVSAVSPGTIRAIGAPIVLPHADEYVLTIGGGSQVHRGRVLDDADGSPVEGASVTAGSGGPGIGFLLVRTFTDAEGGFEVAVPEGDGGLFVEAEGYAPHTGQLAGAGGELEIRLLRTARVTGRVLAKQGGEGVEGVWAFAMPMEGGFSLAFPAAVKTGASGRFEMPGIVPGAVTIFAMGGGWSSVGLADVDPQGYNPLAHTLAAGESKEITLEVEEAGRLEGRVSTKAGKGVSGAVLALQSSFFAFRLTAQTARFGGGVGSAVAGDDGAFAVDTLIPGVAYRVEATAVGSPPYRSDELTVKSGETGRIEIVLEAARWLTLKVESSDGSPLAGAAVEAAARQAGDDDFQRVPGSWRTDANGVARVGPLPPGPIGVQVEAGEHLALQRWQGVSDGAATDDLADTVVLEQGLAVGGSVVVPEGASPVRVSITVQSRRLGRGRWVWEHTSADADGTWRVGGLPDGTYEVEAELAWKDEHWEATATASAGDEDLRLELVSAASGSKGLVVKILDTDGNPVAGGGVRMTTRSKNSSGTASRSFSNGQATFEVDADEEEVWIQAWARPGSGLGAARIGPIPERSGEVVVTLPRAQTIEGLVADASGKGVGGVRVEASLPSPLSGQHTGRGAHFALTDEDGRFELRDLGEGTHRVQVRTSPAYGPVSPRNVESGTKDLRFEVQEAASADLVVLDYAGKPVAGARVDVSLSQERAKATGLGRQEHDFKADGDGIAHVRGLAPGIPHVLTVRPPDGRDDVHDHVDESWSPASGTVRLERAYVIAGVVRDLTGRPVAEAWVRYGKQSEPGSWSGEQTEEDGTFRIRELEQGTYRVWARIGQSGLMVLPGNAPADGDFLLVEAGTTDLVLKVDPGATLRIRIKPWTGSEWGHPIVLREQRGAGSGSFERDSVDSEGRAVFRGCSPDKRYDVFVSGLPDHQYVLARDLRPGDEEIVLAPETGGTIRGRLILPSGADTDSRQVSARILGFQVGGTVEEDGTFEIHGVPPGTWDIVAYARKDGDWLTASARAAPGGSVDLPLAAR